MTESKAESAADRAIREALESVERIEKERVDRDKPPASPPLGSLDATDDEADAVQVLDAGDPGVPPSADVVDPTRATPSPPPQKKSASDALLEATIKAKAELQDVLAQTQKEAKDMFDRLARVSADFDNYKKRVGREKEDAIKFGNEKVFKELLPILDNLQRALLSAPVVGADGSAGAFTDGVKLVAKAFEDALGKFGVRGFDSHAKVFDPQRHEAVGGRADANIPPQHVCEEYQRGYLLHDRLLRPALVIVSTGPASN